MQNSDWYSLADKIILTSFRGSTRATIGGFFYSIDTMIVEVHPATFDPTNSTLYVYRKGDALPIGKIDSDDFQDLLCKQQKAMLTRGAFRFLIEREKLEAKMIKKYARR
jgi:hypothetical protein